MLLYIEKINDKHYLRQPYGSKYITYNVLSRGQIKLSNQQDIQMPAFILGSYNKTQFGIYCAPINDQYIQYVDPIDNGSLYGQNLLNNTSGIFDTTKLTNFYKLSMQFGKDMDEAFYTLISRYVKRTQHEGNFSVTDPELVDYIKNYSARLYFKYSTNFVKGDIEIKAFNSQYVPLAIVPKYESILFHSIKPQLFKGNIDTEEDVWIEPIINRDNNDSLAVNFFGIYTGQSYKYIVLKENVNQLFGLFFDGRNIYQLANTVQEYDNTLYSDSNNDATSNNVLIIYDLLYNTVETIPVQYDPIYSNGIAVIGNLLLINDLHGIIVTELIDATPEYDESSNRVTVKFPFSGYQINNYPDTTGTIDDTPAIDNHIVRIFGGVYNKMLDYNFTLDLSQYRVVDNQLAFDQIELTPTYIDSLQYLYGIDRKTLEPVAELYSRVRYMNQGVMFPESYIYPIPISANITSANDKYFVDILQPQNLTAPFGLLTANNYHTINEPINDYTLLFTTKDDLKSELKSVLGITRDSLLERSATDSLDNTIEAQLTLVDENNKPIAVKYYLKLSVIDDTKIIVIDDTYGNDFWKYPAIDIKDFYNNEEATNAIENQNLFLKDNTFTSTEGQQHTYTKEEISYRNIQAGRIVGIVNNNPPISISYIFN